MTTLCEFRHEAGPEYDPLAARMERALEGVPELVEDVTGLHLPTNPPPRVLLAGREECHRAGEVDDEALIARETANMRLPAHQVEHVRSELSRLRERASARWINVSGMLLRDSTGRPQVVAIADSLHHTGATDAKLVQFVAHELTHVAQHHASGGRIIDYATSWIARRRTGSGANSAPLDPHRLNEGHALWADKQIMSRLGLTAVGIGEGTYTRVGELERARWADEDHTQWIAKYTSGFAFVRHVIEARGREVINRIWADPERLCPTGPEVDAPDTYLAFLDQHVDRTVGLPPVLDPASIPGLGSMVQLAPFPAGGQPTGQQPQP